MSATNEEESSKTPKGEEEEAENLNTEREITKEKSPPPTLEDSASESIKSKWRVKLSPTYDMLDPSSTKSPPPEKISQNAEKANSDEESESADEREEEEQYEEEETHDLTPQMMRVKALARKFRINHPAALNIKIFCRGLERTTRETVMDKIVTGSLHYHRGNKTASELEEKLDLKTKYGKRSVEMEEAMRRARMQEALKQRNRLKGKLEAVHKSLDEIQWEEFKSHQLSTTIDRDIPPQSQSGSEVLNTINNFSPAARHIRTKTFEELAKKLSHAKAFTKRMSEDRRKYIEREEDRIKSMNLRILEQIEEDQQFRKEQATIWHQKREEEREKLHKIYAERKTERMELLERIAKENKQRGRSLLNAGSKSHCHSIEGSPRGGGHISYLYQQHLEKEKSVLFEELENRKSIIKQKRDLMKPIKELKIDEHTKSYSTDRVKKSEERLRQKLLKDMQFKELRDELKVFKTGVQDRILSLDREEKLRVEKEGKKSEEIRRMQLGYANQVQEIYKPKVSPKKAAEMEQLISETQTKPRRAMDYNEMYRRFDRKVLLHPMNHNNRSKAQSRDTSISDMDPHPRTTRSHTKHSSQSHKTLESPTPPIPTYTGIRPNNQVDYLRIQRQKREYKESRAHMVNYASANTNTVEQVLNNEKLTYFDKIRQVRSQAEQMEMKARRKEKLMKMKGGMGGGGDVSLGEEVSDLFIGAIKAKLSLLDQI